MRNVSLSRLLVDFYVILSVATFFEITAGLSVREYEDNPTKLMRRPRQAGRCEGFKCTTTGECLEDDKRCDGKVDCKDGSDEFNDCKEVIQCPGYLFTCDYGACIDKDKKCDGKKDCRDNSDEANCVISNNVEKISSNCKSDQFECKSGQCISQDAKCNGKPDCEDRSDETKETCLNMQCPGWTFKCDYGACVDGFAKCNDVKDCVDNSDEEDCGKIPVVPTPIPTPIPDTTSTGTGGCVLPEHPDFGQWSIVANISKNPSETVGTATVIQFGCNDGYKLSSEISYLICIGNKWNVPPPTCLKKCRALYTTKFTTIRCFDTRRIEIKCDEATEGATATFECAPYYEPSDRTPVKRFCFGGTWNYPEPVCQPVCGEKKVSAQPLIVNGLTVQKGDYPWVTAIFRKIDGGWINACGGSMLTQKIILTAAHCVTDNSGTKVANEEVLVAVGKYYNKYKDPRDTQDQYSKVEKIEVPDKYKADSQRFALDIAILVTKEVLLLSKVVQPVCYQNVPNIHLKPTLVGVITGWGYTTTSDQPSDELKEIDVPYKPDSECYKELPPDWADKYLTPDKMCAGHYNKSIAVCRGDSGGGLVFRYEKRYFVHGVVSIGHTTPNGCDVQVSSLYTKVSSHYEWMEQKIAENSIW